MKSSNSVSTIYLAQIALMAACILVLGFIPPIPTGIIPVPIVVQNLGIMLAGVILGPKKGTASVAIFMIISLIMNGPAQFFGPSSGYLYAWLVVPFLIGYFIQRFNVQKFTLTLVIVWIWGVFFMDLVGGLWLAWYTHAKIVSTLISSLVFIPGDTIKAIITALIGPRIAQQVKK